MTKQTKISQASVGKMSKGIGYPVQDAENIPEWLARMVYQGYVAKYGKDQSYERIRERGGFGRAEVVWYLRFTGHESMAGIERTLKVHESGRGRR